MPTVKISPVFNDQTLDATGLLASGYKLFTYAAGSSTKQTTYTDSAGLTPQTNPIILNALGYPTNGPIWLTAGLNYKFVLAPSTDTDPPASPVKTIDNVAGVNDASISVSQWLASGVVPTYISAASFSLAGDQTTEFHVGRRVQFTVTAGTVYGMISASAYASVSTITVLMDAAQVLDAGLSAVNLSILRADNSPLPQVTINQKHGADIASATTINLNTATGNLVDVTGTNTITAITLADGYERTVRFTGALTLTNGASLVLPGGANYTTVAGDYFTFRGYAGGVVRVASYALVSGLTLVYNQIVAARQTVLSGPVDTSGLPTFLPATSGTLALVTQNVSTGANALVVTASQGSGLYGEVNVVGQSTANLTWPNCTASNTNYLPVLVSGGILTPQTPVILAPIYQWGGTPSTAAGQYTYNIQQRTMYLGNGTTAPAVNHVIVGECVAGVSTITSSIPYAYQGRYEGAFTNTFPGVGTLTSNNHNIGTTDVSGQLEIEAISADVGYSIGDRLQSGIGTGNASDNKIVPVVTTSKVISFTVGSANPLALTNKTTGAAANGTVASWKYRLTAMRKW